jgi:sulfur carrier protein ThiS
MLEGRKATTGHRDSLNEEKNFGEFRRKVKSAEVLSASMEHLLLSLGFTARVSVVMQNGRVLKSGYEEGYFHQRHGGGADDESTHKL